MLISDGQIQVAKIQAELLETNANRSKDESKMHKEG